MCDVCRDVTRLDGVRSKNQVWRPNFRTWGLSAANVLYWKKYLWHCWDLPAPSAVIGRPRQWFVALGIMPLWLSPWTFDPLSRHKVWKWLRFCKNEATINNHHDCAVKLRNTGCFTIVETKRQLLKPLSMTLFIFLFPDCHREIVNLSIY